MAYSLDPQPCWQLCCGVAMLARNNCNKCASADLSDGDSVKKGKPALASMRKACQDAMLVILKSEEPALMDLQAAAGSGPERPKS